MLKLIKAKQKGHDVHSETAATDDTKNKPPSDLLDALRRSVAQHAGNGKGERRPRKSGDTDLPELTKRQLVSRAKQRNVEGYSTMNKDELIAALA